VAEVVLGVAGGIAAYKACELLRLLAEAGHRVRVVPTAAALRFVGTATWEALSGQPVAEDVWSAAHEIPHVRLGRHAELVVVAPATADLLAKAASGLADDLLTNTLLTARCPVLYAPAMHTEMWEHPATGANVATLRERLLARGASTPDLAGRLVVVTAGGTHEPLDPVRFLGNRSSGKQGYAFARTAVARGAAVRLVAANVTLPEPAGVELVRVETTEQLRKATLAAAVDADVVVMAAAPADFRPAQYEVEKLHRDGPLTLPLVPTTDIAAELGAAKPAGQVLVAFAAETAAGEQARANARAKRVRKGADLIVLNQVGGDADPFGSDTNAATVFGADGSAIVLSERSKDALADAVWDLVQTNLAVR
jgi:phosphopantothenoylcysteine decarboxylase / phosphopantothenate---cysteine ligase